MPVEVVAIVSPVPGKEARVEEILKELIAAVEKNEPDVLRYRAYKSQNAEGATEYVFTERYVPLAIQDISASEPMLGTCTDRLDQRYKDEATMEAHMATEAFGAAGKAFGEEGLVSKGLTIYKMEYLAGFDSR
jgi:quinol monooxygenase YgiN